MVNTVTLVKHDFGLRQKQITERNRLITTPLNWEEKYIKNCNGKTLRIVFATAVGTPPRGTVFLSPGRAQTAEKNIEFSNIMTNAGYNFVTYDPQGQGLSYRHNNDNTRHHITTWETEINDMEDVLRDIQCKHHSFYINPVFIVGHSRGSATATRLLVERSEWQPQVQGLVHIAPMFDIQVSPVLRKFSPHLLSWKTMRKQLTEHAPGQGEFSLERYKGHMNNLTRDAVRRTIQYELFRRDPSKICGGATYGFAKEAFKCAEKFQYKAYAESLSIPTWFALGGAEKINSNEAAIEFANRMPFAEVTTYEGAEHQIQMERKAIREPFYKDLLSFFEKLSSPKP